MNNSNTQTPMFCPECGKPVQNGADLCPECAAKRSQAYVPPVQPAGAPANAVKSGWFNRDVLILLILSGVSIFFTFIMGIVTFIDNIKYFSNIDFFVVHWNLNDFCRAILTYAAAAFVILYLLLQYKKGSDKKTFMGFAYFALAAISLLKVIYWPLYELGNMIMKYESHFDFAYVLQLLVYLCAAAAFVLGGIALLKRNSNKIFDLMVLIAPIIYCYSLAFSYTSNVQGFFVFFANASLGAAMLYFAIVKPQNKLA